MVNKLITKPILALKKKIQIPKNQTTSKISEAAKYESKTPSMRLITKKKENSIRPHQDSVKLQFDSKKSNTLMKKNKRFSCSKYFGKRVNEIDALEKTMMALFVS